MKAGDHVAAVSFMEKAVEAAPDDRAARDGLAQAVRARAESHGKAEAITAAGRAALEAGAFDKAIGYFEKALEDWRDSPSARAGLAEAISRQRASTKARALQLAAAYMQRGQSGSAREEYLKALAADPDDAAVLREATAQIDSRPLPTVRARLNAWSDAAKEALPWMLVAAAVVLVVGANTLLRIRSGGSIDVLPFDGPGNFRTETGAAMAAIASSQLHSAGFRLEPGVVSEPLTALSGKLTDAQTKMIADLIAGLFPQFGYRLQAIVFEMPGVAGLRVTAKLVRFRFLPPRERVIQTITFGHDLAAPTHETLARLTAAWAEWHVTRP
jgi:Tfp pilus assembly protein PilF